MAQHTLARHAREHEALFSLAVGIRQNAGGDKAFFLFTDKLLGKQLYGIYLCINDNVGGIQIIGVAGCGAVDACVRTAAVDIKGKMRTV